MTKVIMELSKEILNVIKYIIESQGVNDKIGINTLKNSNLEKNASVTSINNDNLLFNIILNDYIQYIDMGRKPNGKFPPIEPIIKWARSKGIPTDNSTIFLIRRAIARDGIKPRKLIEPILNEIDNLVLDKYLDKIFDNIIDELNKYFNK